MGLRNVTWRTPGADGGRDIEGIAYSKDISGYDLIQKWYVECKRYSSSLDWPTVWNKIAYAEVQGADILLIASNSNPSPRCETEIEEWNTARRRPIVRFWRGYDLPAMVRSHPAIGASYGLLDNAVSLQASTLPLALLLSKITQCAYAENAFDSPASISLETGAAVAELLTQSLNDLDRYQRLTLGILATQPPHYDWLTATGTMGKWGDLGLRAALCALIYVQRARKLHAEFDDETANIKLIEPKFPYSSSSENDILIISQWSHIDIDKIDNSENHYQITQRKF